MASGVDLRGRSRSHGARDRRQSISTNPGTASWRRRGRTDSNCYWRPIGPISQVQAAQAAVNARQTPNVDPNMPGVEANVPEMVTPVGGQTGVVRAQLAPAPGFAPTGSATASPAAATGSPSLPTAPATSSRRSAPPTSSPAPTTGSCASSPRPIPHIGPADEDENGYTYVNNRTFFWLDRAAGQWNPVTATASAGGVSVTVQAQPVRLVVDPGNGDEPVRCTNFEPVLRDRVRTGGFPPDQNTCSYTYTDSSAMAPNGQTWPVTTSIVWHVTWNANTGQSRRPRLHLHRLTTTRPPGRRDPSHHHRDRRRHLTRHEGDDDARSGRCRSRRAR